MGMFDKDKEIGRILTSVYSYGDKFILRNATVEAEPVQTEIGPARKTVLETSPLDKPQDVDTVSTLASAIADKAEQAEPDDFPCVVELLEVNSNFGNRATVLQFVRPWDDPASVKSQLAINREREPNGFLD